MKKQLRGSSVTDILQLLDELFKLPSRAEARKRVQAPFLFLGTALAL